MTTSYQPNAGKQQTDLQTASPNARSHQESLRSKIVLSVAGIFLLFVAIDEVVRQYLIQPEIDAFVEFKSAQDANRVLAALDSESNHLNVLTTTWANQIQANDSDAAWNADFTKQCSPKNADWIATVSPTGQWRWIAKNSESKVSESAIQAFQSVLEPSSDPRRSDPRRSGTHGIAPLGPDSLALFSLAPLQKLGNERGWLLLVARNLDDDLLDAVRNQTQVAFTLQTHASGDREPTRERKDNSKRIVEIPIIAPVENQAGAFTLELPREFVAGSQRTTRFARSVFILGSVLAFLVLLHRLHSLVIRPLNTIRTNTNRLPKTESNRDPLIHKGNDEINDLARAFDAMANRVEETEKQLHERPEENSCIQVASSVIHNVGNVQTNVNSLIEAACERTRQLRISPLKKLAERLRSEEPDVAMLEATPDYLEHLAGSLQSDQQSINELLCTLNDNVRHIRDIIHAQQQHTEPSLEICSIPVQDLIEEAVACCRARLEADAVEISISGQLQVEIRSDRSLMLQTMINLIGNARNALRSIDSSRRQLQIDVRSEGDRIEIDFQDNGCGINPEILDRIFDSKFTTRDTGTGLGLHFCAVTLKNLGGSIRASSGGLNQGSVFTIEVPTSLDNLVHSPQTIASGKTS
ncbi:MAG: ATP-binding protein [Rubripirellula sp.]|nr:ATP-binding protein [Rubripirellula sp.]